MLPKDENRMSLIARFDIAEDEKLRGNTVFSRNNVECQLDATR